MVSIASAWAQCTGQTLITHNPRFFTESPLRRLRRPHPCRLAARCSGGRPGPEHSTHDRACSVVADRGCATGCGHSEHDPAGPERSGRSPGRDARCVVHSAVRSPRVLSLACQRPQPPFCPPATDAAQTAVVAHAIVVLCRATPLDHPGPWTSLVPALAPLLQRPDVASAPARLVRHRKQKEKKSTAGLGSGHVRYEPPIMCGTLF